MTRLGLRNVPDVVTFGSKHVTSRGTKATTLSHIGANGSTSNQIGICHVALYRRIKSLHVQRIGIAEELDIKATTSSHIGGGSNVVTGRQLGVKALYEIATLPPEQRESTARRYIRVADELTGSKLRTSANVATSQHIGEANAKSVSHIGGGSTYTRMGLNSLYLIATLPPDQRDQPHTLADGTTKKPDEMTVRELRISFIALAYR